MRKVTGSPGLRVVLLAINLATTVFLARLLRSGSALGVVAIQSAHHGRAAGHCSPPGPASRSPSAVIGALPAGFGTMMARAHWLPVMRMLEADFWAEVRLMASRAGDLFDVDGNQTDAKSRERLAKLMRGFTQAF